MNLVTHALSSLDFQRGTASPDGGSLTQHRHVRFFVEGHQADPLFESGVVRANYGLEQRRGQLLGRGGQDGHTDPDLLVQVFKLSPAFLLLPHSATTWTTLDGTVLTRRSWNLKPILFCYDSLSSREREFKRSTASQIEPPLEDD